MKYRIIERTYSTGDKCYIVQRKFFFGFFWEDDMSWNDPGSNSFYVTLEQAQQHIARKTITSVDKVVSVW